MVGIEPLQKSLSYKTKFQKMTMGSLYNLEEKGFIWSQSVAEPYFFEKCTV